MSEAAEHADHGHTSYEKVWVWLCVLLVISLIGPELGIRVVTLIAAFGIAVVKAYLVAKHFMHLNIEPRYIVYLMTTMLVFMLLFFAGTAPDVMKFGGTNWDKPHVSTQLKAPHAEDHYGESAGHGEAPSGENDH